MQLNIEYNDVLNTWKNKEKRSNIFPEPTKIYVCNNINLNTYPYIMKFTGLCVTEEMFFYRNHHYIRYCVCLDFLVCLNNNNCVKCNRRRDYITYLFSIKIYSFSTCILTTLNNIFSRNLTMNCN